MGEETRARALDKLATFTPKIGYPERWKSYDGLEVDPADLLGNVRRSARLRAGPRAGARSAGRWTATSGS